MWIVCDWGSSRLRAWLLDADGKVLNNYESDMGVKQLAGRKDEFHEEMTKVLRNFEVGFDIPIRISGMAGSKNGWIETEYASTPTGIDNFSSNYKSIQEFPNLRVYGGIKHETHDGAIDVMRGEEIQVFGILLEKPDARLICLPGTHSKWVKIENGKIASVRTHMTGDLFHSLSENSIFKEQITSTTFDGDGFLHGCHMANEGSGLDRLFRLRTEYVFSKVSANGFHSCLSGFLIANEILAQKAQGTVHLCGSGPLIKSYALALEQIHIKSIPVDSESATVRAHIELKRP
ncbi:MAG: 2-dehydro-3-deoxygalactonokinase [Akkermansiaceae bacterium]